MSAKPRYEYIVEAEKIKKAKKLLKLTVDLGFEKRTVVSGIALHYQPEIVVGQQVVLVANLAPRKMMGIESQGMILMFSNFLTFFCSLLNLSLLKITMVFAEKQFSV